MKARLIAAAVLVVALVALLITAGNLKETHHQMLTVYEEEYQKLESRAAEIAQKQVFLDQQMAAVKEKQDAAQREEAAIRELEEQLQELQTQKEQLLADIEGLEQALEGIRNQQEESDESYYLEVYDALTEGLNKVKGYLAGN